VIDNRRIRAMLNDPDGIIFTDEHLKPFVETAEHFAEVYAAGLAAMSKHNFPYAAELFRLVGIRFEKSPDASIRSDEPVPPAQTP
jgi:hypothetical protein